MTDHPDVPGEPAPGPAAEPRPKVTRARATTVQAAPAGKKRTRPPAIPEPESTTAPEHPAEAPADVIRDLVINQGGLDTATAERIEVHRGGIREARGTAIDVAQGGIAHAVATDIAVSRGGIALARGERVSIEMGGAAFVLAREARVSQGGVRTVLAGEVHVTQGGIGSVVANHVTVHQPSAVGIILARHVHGEVRALLDWRGAIAFGAVVGLLMGVLRRRR